MNDPGSLQNLNDIALPAPPGLWPPAPGWYVVLAALLGELPGGPAAVEGRHPEKRGGERRSRSHRQRTDSGPV